jgi:hypothetical protein
VTAPAPTAAGAARAVLGGTALGAGLVALVLAASRVEDAYRALAPGFGDGVGVTLLALQAVGRLAAGPYDPVRFPAELVAPTSQERLVGKE